MITATPAQLRRAADIVEQIHALQIELRRILGEEVTVPAVAESSVAKKNKTQGKATRKMSAAAKAKLSSIAKKRWAKARKAGKRRL